MNSASNFHPDAVCELVVDGEEYGAVLSAEVKPQYEEVHGNIGVAPYITFKTGPDEIILNLEFFSVTATYVSLKKEKIGGGKERWLFRTHASSISFIDWNGPVISYFGESVTDIGKQFLEMQKASEDAYGKFLALQKKIDKHVVDTFKNQGMLSLTYVQSNSFEQEQAGGMYGMMELLPGLKEVHQCPADDCNYSERPNITLYSLIQHLNDIHRWTREEIADWLESLDVDLTFQTGGTDDKD